MYTCTLSHSYSLCIIYTSSFARSATSPSFAYVCIIQRRTALCAELLLPDYVRFSCCSLIASIRFKLLFLVSVRFSCCPPIASLQLLLATCVWFSCSSPISTAPRLRPLRLLLPDSIASASTAAPRLRPLQLQLPDCFRFDCCSPIASACNYSLTCSGRFQPMPNVLERSSQSSRFSTLKYEGRASLV